MERGFTPQPQSEYLLQQQLDDETVVYHQETQEAHALRGPLAELWGLCDGRRTSADLVRHFEEKALPDAAAFVRLSCEELAERGLLAGLPSSDIGEGSGGRITRRQAFERFAVAAGLVTPLVLSITAPTPAAATSPAVCVTCNGVTCNPLTSTNAACCSGLAGVATTCQSGATAAGCPTGSSCCLTNSGTACA